MTNKFNFALSSMVLRVRKLVLNIFLLILSFGLFAVSVHSISIVQAQENETTPSRQEQPTPTTEAQAQGNPASITISSSFNKKNVQPEDAFELSITVENTSSATFQNVEVRVPFLEKIADVEVEQKTPEFNKILDAGDYPSGFTNRSWLINTLDANAKRTYLVTFTVDENLTMPGGLMNVFDLPSGWEDPVGLSNAEEQKLNYFRSDLYYEGEYLKSVQTDLPKLDGFDEEIAFVKLPEMFTGEDSKTTDLKTITSENIENVENFTLESEEALVEWQTPLDLSGESIPEKLESLNLYFNPQNGRLEINIVELPFLSEPAKVTLKNIDLANEPKLRVDTAVEDLSNLENSKLDKDKGTLSFELPKLVSVIIVPNIIFGDSAVTIETGSITIDGKVSHPRGLLEYKINDAEEYTRVTGIDIVDGTFSLKIDDVEDGDSIELQHSSPETGELIQKIVKVNDDDRSEEPSITEEPEADTTAVAFWDNPLITPLLILLAIVGIITGGYIYYIYYKRKIQKKKQGLQKQQSDGTKSDAQQNNKKEKTGEITFTKGE